MNPGTDYTSAGCDWEEEILRAAGFTFSLAEASRPLSRSHLNSHKLLELEGGGLLPNSGKQLIRQWNYTQT